MPYTLLLDMLSERICWPHDAARGSEIPPWTWSWDFDLVDFQKMLRSIKPLAFMRGWRKLYAPHNIPVRHGQAVSCISMAYELNRLRPSRRDQRQPRYSLTIAVVNFTIGAAEYRSILGRVQSIFDVQHWWSMDVRVPVDPVVEISCVVLACRRLQATSNSHRLLEY